ncbi:hypothetical protein SUGI_1516610 [Cryptomeria japonica]|uniref:SKP1-like protein n=1 Tax=Cryptomeria japonica TaxID=3369 RepID=A0AAD3NPN7_CRYJA|nr:SKP1-like protein 1B [Cryptomeria japonica]GLJ59630.1 hypothetical protein SUGI_1516610 [Cryptomeria japonica]
MEGKVILSSSDGQVFEVDMKVAMISQTLSNMLKDTEDTGSETAPIKLANVSSRIFNLIIEYGKYHVEAQKSDTSEPTADLKKRVRELVADDKDTFFQLMIAANFLHIQSLLDLSYQIVAEDIAACKDQQMIRQKYNIENDYSPEEEEEVLKLHNIFE